eukprot:TRINITY_DN4764_c0_g1_i3.p1 TRINITY_DN4764_c0_g1~~TRINITY_DN4764_c0_g1_i3.p1  ORF type:complete len:245 (+),score=48.20 TRINITY_DN4764_c0_g1_i3:32-736(+)
MAAYANLSPVELAALTTLKQRCAAAIATDPQRYDDMYLMRFLRWRDFNVDILAPLFDKHVTWVESYGIKGIVEEVAQSNDPTFVFLRTYWPVKIQAGVDRRGYSFSLWRHGLMDFLGLESKIDYALLPRYIISYHELAFQILIREIREVAARTGDATLIFSPIGILFINDLTELGWRHMHKKGLEALFEALDLAKFGYPEPSTCLLCFRFFSTCSNQLLARRRPTGRRSTAPTQ